MGYSQNLVLNPSFEEFDTCVINYEFYFRPYLNNWINPNKNTPDIFNSCSSFNSPSNSPYGSQIPRTMNALSGIIAFNGSYDTTIDAGLTKEFIEGTLLTPLIEDSIYCVKFFMNLAENWHMPISKIGVYFSDTLVKLNSSTMPFSPQIQSPSNQFFADETNWMKWQQPYKAKGGEKYFIIGNFNSLANTPKIPPVVKFGDFRDSTSYYYIDDVSVELISSYYADLNIGSDSVLCDTSGFMMTLSAPSVYDSLRWSTGETTNQIQINSIGSYNVRAYFGECEVYDTVSFLLFRGNTFIPIPDTASCQKNAPLVLNSPSSFDSYRWSTSDTTASVSLSASGDYTLTVSDFCFSYIDSFRVTFFATPPPPLVADTAICQGESPLVVDAIGTAIRWFANPQDTISLLAKPLASTETAPTTFSFYATQSLYGCESEKARLQVSVNPLPVVTLPDKQKNCVGVPIVLATAFDSSYSYLWSTGDTAPSIKVSESGVYFCEVSNNCGAVRGISNMEFVPCSDCIYAPNAFTPNGDNKNDVYQTFSSCPLRFYQLAIFNRWGEQVFYTEDEKVAWDGSFKETPQPPGVYVYRILVVNQLGNSTTSKGSITLIR